MIDGQSGAPRFLIEHGGKLYVTTGVDDVTADQDYQDKLRSGQLVDRAVVAPGTSAPIQAKFSLKGSVSFGQVEPD